MIPPRLVLATSNAGKVGELAALVAEWGPIEVLSLADFPGVVLPEETGETYLANAALKAVAVRDATGLPALADDSGIEVDALGGEPGLRSSRYGASAAERIEKLLRGLADVPPERRGARFRAVVVLAFPDGRVVSAEGTCEGRVALAPSGTTGFGYDPIFISSELGRTIGDATAEDKARISHRARAIRALGTKLNIASP
ncbi:MAG TPA: RdgB/HAM1 family non-canonical purine NTP pyrophosphatase [Candidatus Eisenbacteria bacterium]|nr:RdgB/HAM1 family non-canonical purine NTP pyrophosphatase [Candidatus Eisenbacteria bacterium]